MAKSEQYRIPESFRVNDTPIFDTLTQQYEAKAQTSGHKERHDTPIFYNILARTGLGRGERKQLDEHTQTVHLIGHNIRHARQNRE